MGAKTMTLIIMALLGLALFVSYSQSPRSERSALERTQIIPVAPELKQSVWVDPAPTDPEGSRPTDAEQPEPGELTGDAPLPEGTEIGQIAPDFVLPDLDGNAVRLSGLRGHTVLINFWASYCRYSRVEMPLFETLRVDHPELVILGINVGEEIETIRWVTRQVRLSYPILLDKTGEIATTYRVLRLPETFFLDEQGAIVWKTLRAMSERELEEQIRNFARGERP